MKKLLSIILILSIMLSTITCVFASTDDDISFEFAPSSEYFIDYTENSTDDDIIPSPNIIPYIDNGIYIMWALLHYHLFIIQVKIKLILLI